MKPPPSKSSTKVNLSNPYPPPDWINDEYDDDDDDREIGALEIGAPINRTPPVKVITTAAQKAGVQEVDEDQEDEPVH